MTSGFSPGQDLGLAVGDPVRLKSDSHVPPRVYRVERVEATGDVWLDQRNEIGCTCTYCSHDVDHHAFCVGGGTPMRRVEAAQGVLF